MSMKRINVWVPEHADIEACIAVLERVDLQTTGKFREPTVVNLSLLDMEGL